MNSMVVAIHSLRSKKFESTNHRNFCNILQGFENLGLVTYFRIPREWIFRKSIHAFVVRLSDVLIVVKTYIFCYLFVLFRLI